MAETDQIKTSISERKADRKSDSRSRKSSSSSESDRSTAGVRSKIESQKKKESKISFSTKTSTVSAFNSKSMSSNLSTKAAEKSPNYRGIAPTKLGGNDMVPVDPLITLQSTLDDILVNTDRTMKSPSTSSRITPRMTSDSQPLEAEPITSELHVVRNRKARSAPARSRQLFAQSSNLVYLQKECDKVERKMRQTAQANFATRPKIQPYKPFIWNSLAPYYNTDSLRYIINMPVPVRRGYSSRVTASGMVDPAVSWKMDHCLAPVTPSRPELFRQHYAKRRTKSAMPRVVYDNSILSPNYPKITEATYEVLAGSSRPETSRSRRSNKA